MTRSDLIDMDVQVIRRTNMAVLVTLDVPDNAVWIPLSQAELHPTGIGGIETLTLPEWLATEKGLV
jgi:hypothetical protein